ncbi:MAG: carboxypeptidase regulatory-like domain-containing protein, partial [Planctomycetota bacterium]
MKGRGRRGAWVAIVGLLALCAALTCAVLLPSAFSTDSPTRHAGERPTELATDRGDGADSSPAAAPLAAAPAASPDETIPLGDRQLPPDESIRGRAQDKAGKPVGDAIVFAAYKETNGRPFASVVAARVRSEEDGYFVLGPLERRGYQIVGAKEGVGVGAVSFQMPGAWVELYLAPGAGVKGKVTRRANGTPLAGARVVVHDETLPRETTTDALGAYSLSLIPPSANPWTGHTVLAIADGFRTAGRTHLLLKPGREEVVDFAMEPGTTLRGKVLDARTVRPIAGATVGEGWEPFHRTTVTAADGSYTLADVDVSANLIFTARAPGYLPQERQSDGSPEADFLLVASLRVAGRVLNPEGAPAPGSRVYVHRVQGSEGMGASGAAQLITNADAAGAFRFEEVQPGKIAVVAFHREFAPGEAGLFDV